MIAHPGPFRNSVSQIPTAVTTAAIRSDCAAWLRTAVEHRRPQERAAWLLIRVG